MPQPAIHPQVHEALDIHRDFAPEIPFHDKFRHFIAEPLDLLLTEVSYFFTRLHSRSLANQPGPAATDSINGGERNYNMFMIGDIDSSNTGHLRKLQLCDCRTKKTAYYIHPPFTPQGKYELTPAFVCAVRPCR
jgi:hypothetical protein